MRGFQSCAFDPQTLVILETAFDEAWLTLKAIGNTSIKPDELARSVLRLAMDGERDPVRLHDGALKGLDSDDGLARSRLMRELAWLPSWHVRNGRPRSQSRRPERPPWCR